MQRTLTAGLAAGLLASAATAQVHINEIYASHSGSDDQEYVELFGKPGLSLDGYVLCIIEGDGGSAFGTLDRAYDLSGNTIPADGFFVLGDDAVANLDLSVGASNTLENGTNTYLLVRASDPSVITGLLGTDVDGDDDGNSDIPALADEVLDSVGFVDGGINTDGDVVFDGAFNVGPDGSFLPAGIFCDGDAAGNWCEYFWLDFDDVANLDLPRTPGAPNTPCPPPICQPDAGFGGPGGSTLTICGQGLNSFQFSDIDLVGAAANATTLLVLSNDGFPNLPFAGGQVYSGLGFVLANTLATDANGEVSLRISGSGTMANFAVQFVTIDLAQPQFLSFSNAVVANFGI